MRKPASDSITAKVEAAKRASVDWKVPEGLEELTEAEKLVWHQYTSARSDWNDAYLRQLHRLVKMETLVTSFDKEASIAPATLTNRGAVKANPIHAECRSYHASLNSILSVLKITPDKSMTKSDVLPTGSTRGKRKLELLK